MIRIFVVFAALAVLYHGLTYLKRSRKQAQANQLDDYDLARAILRGELTLMDAPRHRRKRIYGILDDIQDELEGPSF